MKTRDLLFAFVAALFVFVGCSQQGGNSKRSALRMKLPDAPYAGQGKVQAASTSGCYAVTIVGEDIGGPQANSCDPAYGIFEGLVSPGAEVTLEDIPLDDGHQISVFFIAGVAGCVDFSPTNAIGLAKTFGADNVHRIADQPLGELKPGLNVKTIIAEHAKPENTFVSLGLTDASDQNCSQANPGLVQFQQSYRQVVGGGRSEAASGKVMLLRMKSHNLSVQKPLNEKGITPYRLGE